MHLALVYAETAASARGLLRAGEYIRAWMACGHEVPTRERSEEPRPVRRSGGRPKGRLRGLERPSATWQLDLCGIDIRFGTPVHFIRGRCMGCGGRESEGADSWASDVTRATSRAG